MKKNKSHNLLQSSLEKTHDKQAMLERFSRNLSVTMNMDDNKLKIYNTNNPDGLHPHDKAYFFDDSLDKVFDFLLRLQNRNILYDAEICFQASDIVLDLEEILGYDILEEDKFIDLFENRKMDEVTYTTLLKYIQDSRF